MRTQLTLSVSLLLLSLLSGAARADVTIIIPDRDNTLYQSASGSLSNGAGQFVFSGATAGGVLRRGLMRFDITAALPAGATVTDVRLLVWMSQTRLGNVDVSLHRALVDWGEGASTAPANEGQGVAPMTGDATWLHTHYATNTWSTPGGDFDPTPSATSPIGFYGAYQWTDPGMAQDVQAWLDLPSSNFGWVIKNDIESGSMTAKRFASRESILANYRPRLVITHDDPAGCTGTNYCVANANSTGSPALMSSAGDCSIAANDLQITASPIPNQPFLFFHAPFQIQAPFGNGFLCAAGAIVRIDPPMMASGGMATRVLDLGAIGIAVPGTYNFQCWFRDPAGGGSHFNTSDGLEMVMIP